MRPINIPELFKILPSSDELISALDAYLSKLNCQTLIIAGRHSSHLLADQVFTKLKNKLNLEFCFADTYSKQNYQVVIGIGGGKVLDFAKLQAKKISAKFISVPTQVTHDGICSPVAVIEGNSQGAVMPTAMFVALDIIKQSPIKCVHSGIGDLIANLSAIKDWQLAHQVNNEIIDDFAITIARRAAINIVHSLKNSANSTTNPDKFLLSSEFLLDYIESLALSGIAMSITGNSRPCSGAEHLISHAIDEIYGHNTKAMHGIQVLVASLYLENLRQEELHPGLKNTLKSFGIETEFEDIRISDNDLVQILNKAPQTRPDRFTILNVKKSEF